MAAGLSSHEKSLVKNAVERLSAGKGTGLVLLKVLYSNAHLSISFTDSFCEVEPEPNTLFYFLSIFRRGTHILKSLYDNAAKTVTPTHSEKLVINKLIGFLDKIEVHARQLAHRRRARSEIDWTLQLCKHLLQELGSDEFIVDELSRDLGQAGSLEYRSCPCCEERLIGGSTGNTSIGHNEAWHGSLDVVLPAPNGNAATPVIVPAFEIEHSRQPLVGKSQILAETIVFSYYTKKVQPDLKNFLIPTVTITRDEILFTFFDPVEDFLIQSESISLFEETPESSDSPEQLRIEAVVALWLVLNYRLFCSGVCLEMKETGYNANFLSGEAGTETAKIYNSDLEFGIPMQSETLRSFARTKQGVYNRVVKGDR